MTDESLESFVKTVCGDSHLRVETDLGGGFVRLRSSEAERRQAAHDIRSTEDVVIELLRNARDAHARTIFLSVTRDGDTRRLVMVDDGDGVPPAMHERVFEPRVTSKLDTVHMDKWGVHGRGMALYSIAANARTARIAASEVGMGSSFVVETNLKELGEKTDQSSFPSFERTAEGTVSVRGPRNIVRTACEFAIECRKDCTLYMGSATDVVATLYAFGLSSLSSSDRAFCTDSSRLPVCLRLATAPDPAGLADEAERLGLLLSERSARRVMDGEIAPLSPLLGRVRIAEDASASSDAAHRAAAKVAVKPKRAGASAAPSASAVENAAREATLSFDARGLKMAPEDLEAFSRRVAEAFAPLARDYYLEPDVEPRVTVAKDGVRVFVPTEKMR